MPYASVCDENGKLLHLSDGSSRHKTLLNINEAKNETHYYGVMLNSFAEVQIFPWLNGVLTSALNSVILEKVVVMMVMILQIR